MTRGLFRFGILASALLVGAAPALAQTAPPARPTQRTTSSPLVQSLTTSDIAQAAVALSYETAPVEFDGATGLTLTTGDGLPLLALLQACDETARPQRCFGLSLQAYFELSAGAQRLRLLADEFNRDVAFAKAYAEGEYMVLEHYVIVDGGVTRDNLAANILEFADSVAGFAAAMDAPAQAQR